VNVIHVQLGLDWFGLGAYTVKSLLGIYLRVLDLPLSLMFDDKYLVSYGCHVHCFISALLVHLLGLAYIGTSGNPKRACVTNEHFA
jgi:hypothetical protein